MREALRMMEERDSLKSVKLEMLREDIGKGLDSVNKGHTRPLDIDAIKTRARSELQKKTDLC